MSGGEVDPMVLALVTELETLRDLLRRGLLNERGLAHGARFCLSSNNTAPGNASVLREQVLAEFGAALERTTGMPASYWTDRPIFDVPDDASGLTA